MLNPIKLDDASHDREGRQERDAFVNQALQTAGLPLLRVRARGTYDPRELADVIHAKIDADPELDIIDPARHPAVNGGHGTH